MRRINIGSLNLLNLRSVGKGIYGSPGYSEAQFQDKVRWIGAMFDQLACELIAVQEVFDQDALQACVERSDHMRQCAAVIAPHAQSGNDLPRVGLVCRLPLLSPVESIVDIPAQAVAPLAGAPEIGIADHAHHRFSRPVLAVTVNLGGKDHPIPARVYVVHLKSRRPRRLVGTAGAYDGVAESMDDPSIEARAHLRSLMMRGIEATGIRHLVLRDLLGSRMPVIVMGDFNDHAKAMTTELITGRMQVNARQRRDHLLWHAAALQRPHALKRDIGYTKIHLGEPDSIDHILVSEEFLRDSRHAIGEIVDVAWFNDHLNDPATQRSDHGAIRATLELAG